MLGKHAKGLIMIEYWFVLMMYALGQGIGKETTWRAPVSLPKGIYARNLCMKHERLTSVVYMKP